MYFSQAEFQASQQELPSILEEIKKRIPHSKILDLSGKQIKPEGIEELTLDDVEKGVDFIISSGNRTNFKTQFKIRKKESGPTFLFGLKKVRNCYDSDKKIIYGTIVCDKFYSTLDLGDTDLYIIKTLCDNNIYFFDSDILRNMCNYPSFWNEGRIACVDKANRRYKIVFDIDRFLHMYNKTAQYLLLGSA